jgi:hypothetical protein
MSPSGRRTGRSRTLAEEFILPGTSTCGRCGGLEALRLATKVIGEKVVYVNAASASRSSPSSPSPHSAARGSTTMGSAPRMSRAFATPSTF